MPWNASRALNSPPIDNSTSHMEAPKGPLQGCLLWVSSTSSGIPFLATKLPIWKKALAKQRADITQVGHPLAVHVATSCHRPRRLCPSRPLAPALPALAAALPQDSKAPGITHVLLGQDTRTVPPELQRAGVSVVSNLWLESCLAQRRRLPEAEFQPPSPPLGKPLKRAAGGYMLWGLGATRIRCMQPPPLPLCRRSGSDSAGASSEKEEAGGGGSAAHRRWLGEEFWRPGCEAMSQTELCLQAVYVFCALPLLALYHLRPLSPRMLCIGPRWEGCT